MIPQKTKLLSILNLIVTLFLIGFIINEFTSKNQDTSAIVYVNNIKLFNEFNMSKDLKIIYEKEIKAQQKIFDSIYEHYERNFGDYTETQKEEEYSKIQQVRQNLDRYKNLLSHESDQQIWNRLHEFLKEYSQVHSYKIVLGTEGKGNILYAEEGIDITTDFLEYVNIKYEGL